ncbi:hypothetical protein FS827_19055 [Agrobacterium vitis]|uniref:hypothetical protein n=1 Tax=Allorhizobium ampelinum TaxID=3025782 RepID=UPI001F166C1D|nr:hypothetical protein [Allorhizobium ampelinum]MCF1463409.1 hypothetical protein [Allorhizobium ampelinum]
MADFVAVIRRAVDGLSNNTPEMRVKVYEKARGAVMRQLDNMTPKPSEDMLRRQLDKLDAAIAEVEADYAEALPAVEEDVYEPEPVYEPAPAYEPEPEPEPVHHEPEPVEEPAHEPEYVHRPEPVHEPEPAYVPAPAPAHVYVPEPDPEPVYEPEPEPYKPEPARIPPAIWETEEPVPPAVSSAPAAPAPAVKPSAPQKHSMDEWLESHLEPTPAPLAPVHSFEAQPQSRQEEAEKPAVYPSIPPARQPVFDEAEALGAFDAFVRDNKQPAAQGGSFSQAGHEDPKDLLDWSDKHQNTSFGTPAGQESGNDDKAVRNGASASKAGEDPAWFDDFVAAQPVPPAAAKKQQRAAAPDRSNSSEDMAAVLAKANRKAGLRTKKSRRTAPYIITGVLILLIGGGGYYAYAHRDNLPGAIAGLKQTVTGLFASKDSSPASAPSSQTGSADAGKPATVPASTGDAGAAGQKFTQKLMPDGTEVDEGASNAAANSGEGRSVAQQNGGANPAAPVSGGAASAPATTTPVQGAPFTVPENGQKAYLYEERLGQTTPTTVQGYIVWEARRETGDSGKPEPEIQGKLTIPERGLTALITFKRNTDSSLPASHLMEIVFSVPQNFEGGGIDSVQRVAMKTSEQDRGDPIVAVPAKITDDTFMIAFNDFAEVVARNVDLLRSRDWIDIPVTYRNGRRALITLDKGVAGKPIFDSVIKEWAALGNNRSGG